MKTSAFVELEGLTFLNAQNQKSLEAFVMRSCIAVQNTLQFTPISSHAFGQASVKLFGRRPQAV